MKDDAHQLEESTIIGSPESFDPSAATGQFQDALSHRQASDLEIFLPASFMARVGAHIVDGLLFIGVLGLAAKLVGIASEGAGQVVSWTVSALLLSFLQSRDGQTPGKKLFQLKTVAWPDGAPVTMKTGLKRELLGRFALGLTLGLGYLTTIFRADKRALHDLVGGTTVLDLESHLPISFRTRFIRLISPVLGVVALIGAQASLTLFSSEPLREIAVALEAQGFQVEGLEGSLAAGFRAEAVRRSDETMDFTLTQIVVDYDLIATIRESKYIINEISADKFHLEIKDDSLFAKASDGSKKAATKETGEESTEDAETKKERRAALKGFHLKDLHVNSLLLKRQEQKFELGETRFTNLVVEPTGKLTLESFSLESSPIKVATGLIAYENEGSEIRAQLEGLDVIVRPELAPEHLAGPVDVRGRLEFVFDKEAKKVKRFDIDFKGLGDRLRIARNADKLEIAIKKWDPSEQVKGLSSFSIEEVSWAVPGDELDAAQLMTMALMQPPQVKIRLGERLFENKGLPTVLVSDDGRIKLVPQLSALRKPVEGEERPPLWQLEHADDREYDETSARNDFISRELFSQEFKHADDNLKKRVAELAPAVLVSPDPVGGWNREKHLEDDLTLNPEDALLATAKQPPRSILVRQLMAGLMKCGESALDEAETLLAGPKARAKDAPLRPKLLALMGRCAKDPRTALKLLAEANKGRPDDPLISAFLAHAMVRNQMDKEAQKVALQSLQDPQAGRLAQAWSLKLLMDHAQRTKNKKLLAKWQKVLQERQAAWRAPASAPAVAASSEKDSQNETRNSVDEGQGPSPEGR